MTAPPPVPIPSGSAYSTFGSLAAMSRASRSASAIDNCRLALSTCEPSAVVRTPFAIIGVYGAPLLAIGVSLMMILQGAAMRRMQAKIHQLRDKLNEMKGAPTIKSGAGWAPDAAAAEQSKIWQPKSAGRKKRVAR